MNTNWTWDEYDTLRSCYPNMGVDITSKIEGRSIVNIESRAEKLNTHIKQPFPVKRIEVKVKEKTSYADLLFFANG